MSDKKYVVMIGPHADCDEDEWGPTTYFNSLEEAEAFVQCEFDYLECDDMVFRIDTISVLSHGTVVTAKDIK